MKIVIIHQHFRTPSQGGSIRSFHLAGELAKRGHEVAVLTAAYSGIEEEKNIEGFPVQYIHVSYDNSFGFLRRMIAYSVFVLKTLGKIRKYKNFDCCYCISTPLSVGIIGLVAKKLYGLPYLFEVGDIWPDIPVQMGIIRNSLFKKLVYTLEHTIYRNAKLIVAISEPVKNIIHKKVPGKDIVVIPNFSDQVYFKPEPKDHDLEIKFKCENKFVISYFGTLGIANKLTSLVVLASHLSEEAILFIKGSGAEMDLVKNKIRELKTENVILLPFGNKNEVRELLNITDVVFICFDPRFPLLFTGCPNKLCDGLAAGKLIILNYDGWQLALLEENVAGMKVDVNSPDNLKEIVYDKQTLDLYKANARKLSDKFELQSLINKLDDALQKSFTAV